MKLLIVLATFMPLLFSAQSNDFSAPEFLNGIDSRVHSIVYDVIRGKDGIFLDAVRFLVDHGFADILHVLYTNQSDPHVISNALAFWNLAFNHMAKSIKSRYQLDDFLISEAKKGLTRIIRTDTRTVDTRNPSFVHPHVGGIFYCLNGSGCDANDRYQTFDGTCNNLKEPIWGRSFRAYSRYLEPDYANGMDEPRRSVSNQPLPNARKISKMINEGRPNPDPVHTTLMMTFGQFLDHDMGLAPHAEILRNASDRLVTAAIDCASNCSLSNEFCLPIDIPENDEDFPNTDCLGFTRSKASSPDDCSVGTLQQLNVITSYLDSSNIYGNTKEDNMELRNTTHPHLGLLRTEPHPLGFNDLLPKGDDPDCGNLTNGFFCFRSGDVRVNENAPLMALHTAYHRYHNFFARGLRAVNPHWSGERLFQEARRIVKAVWQHQIYNEYLPLVVGPFRMKKFGLKLLQSGFFTGYDKHENAEISNAFSAAAFRMGHSAIPDTVKMINPRSDVEEVFAFSEIFHEPGPLFAQYASGASPVDTVIRGLFTEPMEKVNRQFTPQITKHLFDRIPPFGMDLIALNIQRGRDHGIPGYTAWRRFCGLSIPRRFRDLKDIWKPQRKRLRKLYESVDDIELFTGGIGERPVKGGIVGPTFACIIAHQFKSLRTGDRFWFERQDTTVGFTLDQINEIRKSLISKMLCDIGDDITKIQKYSLLQPIKQAFKILGRMDFERVVRLATLYKGEQNEVQECSSLPSINLNLWKELPTTPGSTTTPPLPTTPGRVGPLPSQVPLVNLTAA